MLSNSQFQILYSDCKTIFSKYFVLKVKKTSSADIGIVVSKKIGNSVKRNKIKRQVKEILRTKSFFENLDYHIAFIAKKNIAISSFDSILYDMKNVAKKIRND